MLQMWHDHSQALRIPMQQQVNMTCRHLSCAPRTDDGDEGSPGFGVGRNGRVVAAGAQGRVSCLQPGQHQVRFGCCLALLPLPATEC